MENKELETWLQETKAKNLSKEDLKEVTSSLDTHFYLEIKRKLGVGGTLYEHLFNQWQKETEFSPKRGEEVIVWNDNEEVLTKTIYLQNIEGAEYPILVVSTWDIEKFLEGRKFGFNCFKNMKPLPTELPTETDFKSKVIELIEKRIERYKECEKGSLEMSDEHDAIEYKAIANQFKDFLNQIKQLC